LGSLSTIGHLPKLAAWASYPRIIGRMPMPQSLMDQIGFVSRDSPER
jgi:hypothetical protein